MIIAIALGALAAGFFIRMLPVFFRWQNFGVDHWYWNAYVKALKTEKKFPPDLPNYLIEDAQWYPPLFPLSLSLLPDRVFKKYDHLIAVVIDLARLCLLFFAMYFWGVATLPAVAVAGLFYVTTPLLACYNTQLNPRGLAAFFFDGAFVALGCWVLGFSAPPAAVLWPIAALLGALVLLTHKMNSQLMAFSLLCLSVAFKRWEFAALLPVTVLVAALISNGFYFNVLRHNLGFVRFWTREWNLLGADPLRESPVYGDKNYVGSVRQFEPGFKNLLKRFFSLFVGNYAPVVPGAMLLAFSYAPSEPAVRFAVLWTSIGFSFAFLTVMVPPLRGLGFGNLYLYNAAFPACLALGYFASASGPAASALCAVLFVVNLFVLVRSLRHVKSQKGLALPPDVIGAIARCGQGAWLSYPMQLMEHIACLADRPVLWGGHGDRAEHLGQVFPVLRIPFETLMQKYGLRYILINDAYLKDIERIAVPREVIAREKGFTIIELTGNSKTTA